MKVILIGAGVVGLSSAYFLSKRGFNVTVVDRHEGPGQETSFANGALITPSMPEPWNAPGCWRVLLASLLRSDAPLQLRLRAVPTLMGWGLTFLGNSHPMSYRDSTLRNLRLALFSLTALDALRRQTGLEYSRAAGGTLKLFRSGQALRDALHAADHLLTEGLKLRALSIDETVRLEPALAPIAGQLAGAIHYPLDETGDAYRFCIGLVLHLRQRGVSFVFGTNVLEIEGRSGRIAAVSSDKARFTGDLYVVAAGSYSMPLLKPLGVRLPVRPAKGYSVTFESPTGTPELKVPVVDDEMHAAVVPVEKGVRVAGTAEFAGFDVTLRPERVRNLTRLAQKILPGAALDATTARPWCGLRSMSADGVPIIGRTPIENLWVTTGHGHLGWTMAAGSGQLLAELVSSEHPSVDPASYALSRF